MLPARSSLRALCWLEELQGSVEPENVHIPLVVPTRRTAVDIGANSGVTSVIYARHFQSVCAFEPNPALAEKVRPGLPSNVVLHCVALSDTAGKAELKIPLAGKTALSGWASLGTPAVGDQSTWQMVSVETRTLDSYALQQVDLIKIDVEGHEMAVLAGARDTIARCRPWMIIEAWESLREPVMTWMESLGYRVGSLEQLCGVGSLGGNIVFIPDANSPET